MAIKILNGIDVVGSMNITASDIPSLDANKITTGTLAAGLIPSLDASKIGSGTLSASRIPNLDGSKITTGTIAAARIGDLSSTYATVSSVPTNVSELTNDIGYLSSLPSHNHDDRYYTETEIDDITHQWEWKWQRWTGYLAPAAENVSAWTDYYKTYFTERTEAIDTAHPLQGSGYVNTITNVGNDGGFGGSTYGNIFGDLSSYHCHIYTNIYVDKEFTVNVTTFSGDDPHGLFIDGKYVHARIPCCSNTSYSYTFTQGWHRIDLMYSEGGGGDYIRMGWNPKNYLANISDMTPHRGGENPNYILNKLNALGTLATESYVTTRGYITGVSWNDVTSKPTLDNYVSWNLKTNSVQRTAVGSGADLNLVAGTNVSIGYSAGGTVTISSTDTNTTYSVGDGGLTEKNFTTALKTKLDGIAAGATNVTNNNQLINGAGYLTSLPSHNHDDRYYTETESDARYINSSSDTMTGILKLNAGVTNHNWSTFTHLQGANSLNNPSGTVGAIRIELPIAEYNTNTMMSMTIKVYEYSTGKSFTLFTGGYNYSNGVWYNCFATLVGDNQRGDVPVKFGQDGTRNVIWIGNPDWSWSYPNVWVTDFQSGHTQGQDWNDGWRIVFDQQAAVNVTATETAHQQISTANIASQSVSNAGQLDGIDSSQFMRSDTNDSFTAVPTFAKGTSGTLASRTGYTDFLGYNPTYGSYIGGGAGNSSKYLYSGGYFYDGTSARTLFHTGNFTDNSANWNTAYGWGNHASAGYLTTASAATTYAPLASPALTGTPTAPTAAAATNNTQIATTAFVKTAVSTLVDSAPSTLDTLNELAAALGDDPNFATTVTNSIATKLPLAGGTMTGELGMGNNQISFGTGNVSAPSATNRMAGTRLLLYPNSAPSHYAIGIQSGNMWFTSDGGYIWYRDATTNAMSLDSSSNLSVAGNVTGANLNVSNWNTAYSWGNHASAGYLTSYTETDTLASVTSRGASTTTSLSIRNLTSRTIVPETNVAYDLGTPEARWQIVFCQTLDSAGQHESQLQNPEGEKSVGDYATGTVLVWKGGKNIPCTEAADHMRMGIAVNGIDSPLVQGAEPVLVTGSVNEGDYLVTSSVEGHAKAITPQFMRQHMLFDCVIGKALESGEGDSHLIKTWINI